MDFRKHLAEFEAVHTHPPPAATARPLAVFQTAVATWTPWQQSQYSIISSPFCTNRFFFVLPKMPSLPIHQIQPMKNCGQLFLSKPIIEVDVKRIERGILRFTDVGAINEIRVNLLNSTFLLRNHMPHQHSIELFQLLDILKLVCSILQTLQKAQNHSQRRNATPT